MSMFYTRVQNRWFELIPTHYIVWCNGDFVKVNELENIVWATLNPEANINGIHIEIVWDFNIWEPNEEQYKMVNQLIYRIKEKYPDIEVKWHKDFQAKNCPWKNFDWSKINWQNQNQVSNFQEKESQKNQEKITFKLSRYYTVVPNQKRYYQGRTYEEDFKINCAWDCNVTANWHVLTNDDRAKSVACPKEYELWTKFYLEWIWEVVCNDRWWAIVKLWDTIRLDMWCWIWDNALDNRSSCPTWERVGYIIGK